LSARAPRCFQYLEGDALLPLDACGATAGSCGRNPDLCCLGIGGEMGTWLSRSPVATSKMRSRKTGENSDLRAVSSRPVKAFPKYESVPVRVHAHRSGLC